MGQKIKEQLIPIFLGTTIVASILYIYNSNLIVYITALSFLVQILLYSFYRRVKDLGKLGAVIVAAVSVVLFLIISALISGYGTGSDFFQWIFSAQSNKTRVMQYSIACFICFNFLIASFLYYYTQVIYRNVVILVIVILPFLLYIKRGDSPRFIFVILLLSLYIAVMIRYGQLNYKIKAVTVGTVYWKTIVAFVVFVMIIVIILPKPIINPLNKRMSDMLVVSGIDYGDSLGEFTKYSRNQYNLDPNRVLYKVTCTENLYLRRQTFDLYDQTSWSSDEKYGGTGYQFSDFRGKYKLGQFYEAIYYVAKQNEKFAEKYHFNNNDILESSICSAMILTNDFRAKNVLGVNSIINLTGLDLDDYYITPNNDIFQGDNGYLSPDAIYGIKYYSEQIDQNLIYFMNSFNKDNESNLISDAINSCDQSNDDIANEKSSIIKAYDTEEQTARQYYTDTYQVPSAKIKKLAEDITKGENSDYGKAKAIEQYFALNGYIYDLNYHPGKGNEDIEYFIFNSKRGICSNYATAMTLMARSIGLPARYVEGFLVQKKENETVTLVKASDAHAFTEVFISGYGWMTFDATVSKQNDDIKESVKEKDKKSERLYHINWRKYSKPAAICLLSIIIIGLLVLVWYISREFCYRIRLKFLSDKEAILSIYNHLYHRVMKQGINQTKEPSPNTMKELIYQKYGINIADITLAFEKACYGDKEISKLERNNAYRAYIQYYKASK